MFASDDVARGRAGVPEVGIVEQQQPTDYDAYSYSPPGQTPLPVRTPAAE